MFKFSALLSASLLSLTTYAGTESGNGGDAVVCRNADRSIRSTQLLDYYEADAIGFTLDYGPATANVRVRVNTALDRVARLIPEAMPVLRAEAEKLLAAAEAFDETELGNSVIAFTNGELTDIPDSMHLQFSAGCKVEQFATHLTPEESRYYKNLEYFIQREIWKGAGTVTRAGLIIHEIFYGYARNHLKAIDSRATRSLHRGLFTPGPSGARWSDVAAALILGGHRPRATRMGKPFLFNVITETSGGFYVLTDVVPYYARNLEQSVVDAGGVEKFERTRYANARWWFTEIHADRDFTVEVSVDGIACRPIKTSIGTGPYSPQHYNALIEAAHCPVLFLGSHRAVFTIRAKDEKVKNLTSYPTRNFDARKLFREVPHLSDVKIKDFGEISVSLDFTL